MTGLFSILAGAARFVAEQLRIRNDAREAARLRAARDLDAAEVGRRADERRQAREVVPSDTSTGASDLP